MIARTGIPSPSSPPPKIETRPSSSLIKPSAHQPVKFSQRLFWLNFAQDRIRTRLIDHLPFELMTKHPFAIEDLIGHLTLLVFAPVRISLARLFLQKHLKERGEDEHIRTIS